MILVYIENCPGDSRIKGFEKHFEAQSFSFNVERELAESSKAGTADINIGVGELQECSISKTMDIASPYLARKAIAGSSCGTAEIKFVQTVEESNQRYNVVYLHFKLETAFVKTWSISGDGDDRPSEDITLWYNKIAFGYHSTKDGKVFTNHGLCGWDQVEQKVWSDANAEAVTSLIKQPAS